jgi:hypothetical protein
MNLRKEELDRLSMQINSQKKIEEDNKMMNLDEQELKIM